MRDVKAQSAARRGHRPGPGSGSILPRLRSFVLLAGSVRANSLPARVGRSVLDLPVTDSLRLLDVWALRIREFLGEIGSSLPETDVRILAGPRSPLPDLGEHRSGLRFRAERDASGYRGTAGVLKDLCEQFRDEDYVLVGNASQCPDAGLIRHLVTESDPADGVTLSAGSDGGPTGLMLMRCEVTREIPSVGYIDLKEQVLPGIAEAFGARVLEVAGSVSRPIRDVGRYLRSVRSWHRSGSLAGGRTANPFEERWKPTFSIVEEGAEVGAGARLHDSVVLAGGVVEPGCNVVRSVVGPGGVARGRERVLDRLLVAEDAADRPGGPEAGGPP